MDDGQQGQALGKVWYACCEFPVERRPSQDKADSSPNQIFYGKRHDKLSVYNILGHDIVKSAETDAGLEAAYKAV